MPPATPTVDLGTLDSRQLKEVIVQAQHRQTVLNQAILDEVRQRIQEIVIKAGLTLEDVFPELSRKGTRGPKPGSTVKAKFRNPNTPSQTWAGRGKTPLWLRDLEAQGRKRDEFLIDD